MWYRDRERLLARLETLSRRYPHANTASGKSKWRIVYRDCERATVPRTPPVQPLGKTLYFRSLGPFSVLPFSSFMYHCVLAVRAKPCHVVGFTGWKWDRRRPGNGGHISVVLYLGGTVLYLGREVKYLLRLSTRHPKRFHSTRLPSVRLPARCPLPAARCLHPAACTLLPPRAPAS